MLYMKILLSAYACSPNAGTEPAHGWETAIHLASRGIDVHVLTVVESRAPIEAYRKHHVDPRLNFSYVSVPTGFFKHMSGMHYALWQYSAVKVAQRLIQSEHFDIAHHVTYGSIHVPSRLWRLGLPVVFGPVGGGQTAPTSMLNYFGIDKSKEQRRTLLTRAIRHSPLHRRWLAKMSAVFVANRETMELARALGRMDAQMMFDTIIPDEFMASRPRSFSHAERPLRVLWVGHMRPRKGIALTLDIVAKATSPMALTIVGNGFDQAIVRKMISDRGLTDRVIWQDRRLPREEVRQAYQEHDVMLFTSLRETGGAQLLEAMAMGLPIITLNLHGPGILVPDAAGLKVEVHDPQQVVRDAARALEQFANLSPEGRTRMSEAGWHFAQQQRSSARAEKLHGIYDQILADPREQKKKIRGLVKRPKLLFNKDSLWR